MCEGKTGAGFSSPSAFRGVLGRGREIDSQQWVFLFGNVETWLRSFFFSGGSVFLSRC